MVKTYVFKYQGESDIKKFNKVVFCPGRILTAWVAIWRIDSASDHLPVGVAVTAAVSVTSRL